MGYERQVTGTSSILPQLAERDDDWNEERLREHVKEAFMAIQQAWVEREPERARRYMTDELLSRHRAQIDEMIARQERNVQKKLSVLDLTPIHAADYRNDAYDEVWYMITASAEDYLLHEPTGEVRRGHKGIVTSFNEIWKFRRNRNSWFAYAIEADARPEQVPDSFSEELDSRIG